MDLKDFCKTLYGDATKGWLTLNFFPAKDTLWFPIGSEAPEIRRKRNVYLGLGIRRKQSEGRGTSEDIIGIPGLWLDLDYESDPGSHKAIAPLPPNQQSAMELIESAEHPPSLIIYSGHGLQAYWLFHEVWYFDDEEERREAHRLNKSLQSWFQAEARLKGWHVDSTDDLARVFRVPGTINYKTKPYREVSVISSLPIRFDPSDLDFNPSIKLPSSHISEMHPINPERKLFKLSDIPHLSDRIKYLILHGDTLGRYPSRSEAFFAAIGGLISAGCADDEIAHILTMPEHRISDAASEKGERWVYAEIRRSHEKKIETRKDSGNESSNVDQLPTTTYGDVFNGEVLIIRYGSVLRYCQEWNAWYIWKETHWIKDRENEVYDYARDALKWVLNIAFENENEKLMKHVMRSRSHRALTNMLSQAGTMSIRRLPEHFDTHEYLINCQNGIIDLRDGSLLPHDKSLLLTKCAPVNYEPDTRCDRWQAFLYQIMGGVNVEVNEDDSVADMERKDTAHREATDMIGFLQRAVGYSLYGSTREKVLFIPWGSGDNGKSTFVETLSDILGSGYAMRTPTSLFLSKRESGIPNDVAQLKGIRFAYAAEPPQDRRLDEALIKDLTGGDTISARFMRGEFFTFRPECTLWMSTNHKPPTRDTGNALWNRIKLIPFTVSIPKEEQDKELRAKLLTEAPGILAWAVRGCLDWQSKGLQEPAIVKTATAEYRGDNDTVALFITEQCVILPQVQARSSVLYEYYKRYCDQTGEHAMTSKSFSKALIEKGYDRKASNGIWFLGIAMRQDNPSDEG